MLGNQCPQHPILLKYKNFAAVKLTLGEKAKIAAAIYIKSDEVL